jgi:hypothetical protein
VTGHTKKANALISLATLNSFQDSNAASKSPLVVWLFFQKPHIADVHTN